MRRSGYPLLEGNVWQSIHDKFGKAAGVYVLRLRTEDLSGFQTLHKLLADDPDGTLYIGTSANLAGRVGAMKMIVCSKYGLHGYEGKSGHPVGRMITTLLMSRFKPEQFWVDVTPFSREPEINAHYAEETRLLMEYASKYGEFPSFNGMKLRGMTEGEADTSS
jgi:hypothetical protein